MIMNDRVFDGAPEPSAEPPAIGAVDEIVAVPPRHEVIIRGWAVAPSPMRPFEQFRVIAGSIKASVRYGTTRPDVAAALGVRTLDRCGFEATFEISELGLGEHEVRFEGDDAVLAPIRMCVVSPSMIFERSWRYRAAIDRFSDEDPAFTRPFAVQFGFVGIVSGCLQDERGAHPRLARASIDGGRPMPVQLGLRSPDGSTNGFLFCFDSKELAIGQHRFRLTALSEDGDYGVAADVSFDVVPIACGGPPVRSPIDAPAHIEWVDKPNASGPLRAQHGEVLFVRGWAIDPIELDAPARVYLVFDDGTQYRLMPRQQRRDIAERHDAPRALYCGFVGSIDTGALRPGQRIGQVRITAKSEHFWHRTSAEIIVDLEA
jgi:hypothetical protein